MTDDEILDEFRAADALLEGHFILSSGLRSPRYLQCARVLMDPARAERLARALADKLPAEVRGAIEVVVSPAMGGVIIGHEMGRALGKRGDVRRAARKATFELRRGFALEPAQRVLMVEDVVTTGLSSREAIEAIEAAGGEVIAAAALVDRSGGDGGPRRAVHAADPHRRSDLRRPTRSRPSSPRFPAIKPGSRAAA